MEITISQLAEKAGVTKDTIFYYEKQGLVFPESRSLSNYRLYNEASIKRLLFIKFAQKLGFTLSEIKELLALKDTKGSSVNALDRLIKKVHQLKKDLTKISSQKNQLQNLIKECYAYGGGASDFFDYLGSMSCFALSDLTFSKHSYLYDAGVWGLSGNYQSLGNPLVDMLGEVEVVHEDATWSVKRTFEFQNAENTSTSLRFSIPAMFEDGVNQNFEADCSDFGNVTGSISFAGEDIFTSYEMLGRGVKGCECLRRILSDLYEAKGILNDGSRSICWWNYEMTRV